MDNNETAEYVNSLLSHFRQLVLSIQDEHNYLRRMPKSEEITSSSDSSNQTGNSIKPPSYKTVTKPSELEAIQQLAQTISLAPRAPIRLKRKTHLTPPASDMTTSRGAFIVLEGLDRVGKSTLAAKLVEHLERSSRPVHYCRFPDRSTRIGKMIDTFLKNNDHIDDHVLHLQFSANRWEQSELIKDKISKGITVISDRYAYSGIAYSSAKTLPFKWCCDTERGLPRPDLVLYLELEQERQLSRDGFGDERFETAQFQELVRIQYEKLVKMCPERWIRVSVNSKGPEQVLSEVIVPVRRCMDTCGTSELGTLNLRD